VTRPGNHQAVRVNQNRQSGAMVAMMQLLTDTREHLGDAPRPGAIVFTAGMGRIDEEASDDRQQQRKTDTHVG
jgi:hypothetical protein